MLDAPDNGVFIKNSVSAKVCNLYDKKCNVKVSYIWFSTSIK
ncbi:T3SS effector NleG family protein [Escherichia coli]|nr:T3SS effector NleG family protein [Escherichia coli]